MNTTSRAKFSCIKYDEIQERINSGEIDVFDIIYTTDTYENIMIGPDYSLISVKSKIYRFSSISDAITQLNSGKMPAYEGQIISVLQNGKYVGFIVNKGKDGKLTADSVDSHVGDIDYNNLGNKPITCLEGKIGETVILNKLDPGIYNIKGQYKITASDVTTYITPTDHLIMIGDNAIRKVAPDEVSTIVIDQNENITIDKAATEAWIKAQGYLTEEEIDAKIVAINLFGKEQTEEYVKEVIASIVDKRINETFVPIEHEIINNMFRKE